MVIKHTQFRTRQKLPRGNFRLSMTKRDSDKIEKPIYSLDFSKVQNSMYITEVLACH